MLGVDRAVSESLNKALFGDVPNDTETKSSANFCRGVPGIQYIVTFFFGDALPIVLYVKPTWEITDRNRHVITAMLDRIPQEVLYQLLKTGSVRSQGRVGLSDTDGQKYVNNRDTHRD